MHYGSHFCRCQCNQAISKLAMANDFEQGPWLKYKGELEVSEYRQVAESLHKGTLLTSVKIS